MKFNKFFKLSLGLFFALPIFGFPSTKLMVDSSSVAVKVKVDSPNPLPKTPMMRKQSLSIAEEQKSWS